MSFYRRWRSRLVLACAALALPSASAVAQPAGSTPPAVEGGFGRGITVRAADESFSLNLRARVQIRSTLTRTEASEPDSTSELLIRRMRVVLQGNANGPALTYYVQLSFANLDMEPDLRVPLRDAYLTWTLRPSTSVRVGQMKVPFGRQRVVSSSALQMVDRAQAVVELNLDRDVGLVLQARGLGARPGRVGYSVGIFGGEGRNRLGRDFGHLYVARAEWTPLGYTDDLTEGDLLRVKEPRVILGLGAARNQNTNRSRSTVGDSYPAGGFDYTHLGADALVKFRGWSITAELLRREAEANLKTVNGAAGQPTTIVSRSGWGGYAQVGYLVTPRIELSGRWGLLRPLADTDRTFQEAHELGGSVSYYAQAHNLKLQADYFHLTRQSGAPSTHQVRSQVQLFF